MDDEESDADYGFKVIRFGKGEYVPIKPENKELYPPNWKELSFKVREAANHRCASCGVADQKVITRNWWNDRPVYVFDDGKMYDADSGEYLGTHPSCFVIEQSVQVVLSVHHRDQDPTNNALENLVALCQRCHNHLDTAFRAANRKATRLRKKRYAQ
jgi:hypothetical protein